MIDFISKLVTPGEKSYLRAAIMLNCHKIDTTNDIILEENEVLCCTTTYLCYTDHRMQAYITKYSRELENVA
jgi:hypothetical protein